MPCRAGAVIYVTGAIAVAVQNLHLTGGSVVNGGGVYNNGATTTLSNTLVYSNSVGSGGGIYNGTSGKVAIDASIVASNTATNDWRWHLQHRQRQHHHPHQQQPGSGQHGQQRRRHLQSGCGKATVDASTVASNTASALGGGLYSTGDRSIIALTNSSQVLANGASNGGGIYNSCCTSFILGSRVTVDASTIAPIRPPNLVAASSTLAAAAR